jgi:tetratricopeptide (TPR) repeat protein
MTSQEQPTKYLVISYSRSDGKSYALRLQEALASDQSDYGTWLDKSGILPTTTWEAEIEEAIDNCHALLYLMTQESVKHHSFCRNEVLRALKHRKPVIPLLFYPNLEVPVSLQKTQYIDFVDNFEAGLKELYRYLKWKQTPEGQLQYLTQQLYSLESEIASAQQKNNLALQQLLEKEKSHLEAQYELYQKAKANPELARQNLRENISKAIEEERTSISEAGESHKIAVNNAPNHPPLHFQNRTEQTKALVEFLKYPAMRWATVSGRSGSGKTTLVSRLLTSLEKGILPDNLGPMKVNGIVYLSAREANLLSISDIFYGLCEFLSKDIVHQLDKIYTDLQIPVSVKFEQLLRNFPPQSKYIVYIDNFESLLDPQTLQVADENLFAVLKIFLTAPSHGVKNISTTIQIPHDLPIIAPASQLTLDIPQGLPPNYTVEMLRVMDKFGHLGLRNASPEELSAVHKLTFGHPRAIETLIGYMATSRSNSLEELLEAGGTSQLPDVIQKELIGHVFNRLDEKSQMVLKVLAMYNTDVRSEAIDYILQNYGFIESSRFILNRLVDIWLVYHQKKTYFLHPSDQDYIWAQVSQGELEDRTLEPKPFTKYALLALGAEYFRKIRKPKHEIKTDADLNPIQIEFELLYQGKDFSSAFRLIRSREFEIFSEWGRHDEYYNRVEAIAEYADLLLNLDERANLYALYGNACSGVGDITKAIHCCTEALNLARQESNYTLQAVVLDNLGYFQKEIGDMQKSRQLLQECWEIASQGEDPAVKVAALQNLGDTYIAEGNYDYALQLIEQSVPLLDEDTNVLRRNWNTASTAGVKATVLVDLERYEQAIEQVEECMEITGHNWHWHGSRYNYVLALAYLYKGDLDAAYTASHKATQYNEGKNNHNTHMLYGVLALLKGEAQNAESAFSSALKRTTFLLETCPEFMSAWDAQAFVYCGLTLCTSLNHVNKALTSLQKARQRNSEQGTNRRIKKLFNSLTSIDSENKLAPICQYIDTLS